MDEWLVESFTIQSATSTLGTTQKRASCARHRKQLPIKVTVDICCENFVWRNGKLTKSVFQKAALPKFMVRKAARRGISLRFVIFCNSLNLFGNKPTECCVGNRWFEENFGYCLS